MDLWRQYVRVELDFLLEIQARRHWLPFLRKISSNHPLHDVSLLVWVAFVLSWPTLGYKIVWEFMSVAVVTFAVNWLLGFRVPSDIDPRIIPLSRVSPYGFPSMELSMSVVICIGICEVSGLWYAWPLGIGLISVLAITRLYAAAFLPHQIMGSWAWGYGGLRLARWLADTFVPNRVPYTTRLAVTMVCFALLLAWVMYRVERNAAPFLRVPKSEFMRVIQHIATADEAEEPELDTSTMDPDEEVRYRLRRPAKVTPRRPANPRKVDSFVQMLRSMARTRNRTPDTEGSLFSGMS